MSWYSTSDGSDDLTNWEKCNAEIDRAFRKAVAIECDMELLDWSRLARI
jgi:hypothetical protein